jgi:hypothetical protein
MMIFGRNTMKAGLAATLVLGLGVSTAVAQPAKTLRDQLVGTWTFVIAEITTVDGKKSLPFGDKPKGMLIFTADGLAGACRRRPAQDRRQQSSRWHA